MYKITLTAADSKTIINHEYEYKALDQFANFLLWTATCNINDYSLTLTKDGEVIAEVIK